MTERQAAIFLGVCAAVLIGGYFYVSSWITDADAERARMCHGGRELRDKLRSIEADFKAHPPKTPREVSVRIGPWGSCNTHPKSTNTRSLFMWDFEGPKNTVVFSGGVHVYINKDPKPCDPDSPTLTVEVYGQDTTDEEIRQLYSCL